MDDPTEKNNNNTNLTVRPTLQTANSWPRLPEIALINSQNSRTVLSSEGSIRSTTPISHESDHPTINIESQPPTRESYFSSHTEHDDREKEKENEKPKHHDSDLYTDVKEKDMSDSQKLASNTLDDGSMNTLVEVVMDQAGARDRHVRFHDHVAESAALVQQMVNAQLGTPAFARRTSSIDSIPLAESIIDEEDIRSGRPAASGSVLASLMKLEAKRRQSIVRASHKKNAKSKRSSSSHVHNLSPRSSDVQFSDVQGKPRKRPPMVNRPKSWLSSATSSQHLVPTLEKRKKQTAPSCSRRNSADSTFTTASQFEPITLEDRIRITFEIANILQKQDFLKKLAKSLMLYGCPAHRLEYAMRQVSRTLGVDAEYVYMPNVMFLTFFDATTHTTETHFIRQTQTFEMHRLGEIYRLEKLVSHGEVSVDEALEFIDKVYQLPPIYPVWLNPFAYALAAFSGCILFFGGRWQEAGVAAALGMVFAVYEVFSGRILSFQPIWEITVCIIIGFVARALTRYGVCFTPIAFSAFIVMLPGYTMAVAIIELVSRQLISGVVRMVYAIIYSFLLGYGVSMGSELYLTVDTRDLQEQPEVCKRASIASTCLGNESPWFNFLMVPLFAVAFCVFIRAKIPRWLVMIPVAVVGYVINYALACWAHTPSQVMQVVPSFWLGLVGNLLTKFTGHMSFDAMLLGIFYLVPSSLGLKAALGLFGNTSEFGTQGAGFALAMIEGSIGITIGLFLATLIVFPKGTTHTPLMNF
ncbi:uncharacterized protein BYT42DRAFT_569766 [Radiomyces spectabilis]|uniref:uncharacterized protein n=1 Tax=Radiomyces spectabilis TaxID=64574 RepID=UPI002220C3BA|nr:uncharacterized protein BYT42DRAFT_569766 [Radiomyces spectabilis]KAI8379716.1 hypothetical protein BYT42DRAFT_569766 [Radiomyces spectabilis]